MSSLRKWFSSNSMLRIVQIYFCLTAIGTFVQAEYYIVSSRNSMSLHDPIGSSISRTELTIAGSTFLFIKRDDKNSYTAQLEQTYISTKNFDECDEFKPVATALRKPFKVLLNDNAQFKSMKVSKDDVDLSIALKFLVATSLQANKQKLQEHTGGFNFKDSALSQYGKCTENNKGFKANGNYDYRSYKQPDTCSGLESSASKDDQQFADSICRTKKDDGLHYYFSPYNRITVNSEANEFKKLEISTQLSYTPYKDKDHYLSTLSSIFFELNREKQKGNSRDPEPFNDADSKELTELQYINIDRSMVQGPIKPSTAFLFYKGLACQPVKKNTYLAVLRIAARCSLTKKYNSTIY